MDFPTNHQQTIISTRRFALNVMLLQSTLYIVLGLFNDHNPHRTIWGFYDTKKQQFHAPINSKKVGKVVDIRDTTPFTAMQLNLEHLNPLELAFVL